MVPCHRRSGTFRRVSNRAALAAQASRGTPVSSRGCITTSSAEIRGMTRRNWLTQPMVVLRISTTLRAGAVTEVYPFLTVFDLDLPFVGQIVGVQRAQQG